MVSLFKGISELFLLLFKYAVSENKNQKKEPILVKSFKN